MSAFDKYIRYRKALEDENNIPKLLEWAHKNVEAFYEIEEEWEKEHKLFEDILDIEIELQNRRFGFDPRFPQSTQELIATLNQLKGYKRLKYGFCHQ